VDLATVDNEKGERHLPDPGNYVWQMGANVVAETLATGREPYITVEHSLHVLEIMEAARKSQKTGRRIQLKSKFKWPVV
jgi:predicted dehydrogenase